MGIPYGLNDRNKKARPPRAVKVLVRWTRKIAVMGRGYFPPYRFDA
jgi:hypothetical protein